MTARRLALVLAPVIALAALSACGESVSDNAAEQAIENANPSLDADVQDGGAGVRATDEDGNEVAVGTAAQVPSDFPSVVPQPADLKLLVAGKSNDSFTLQYQIEGDANAATAAYRTALEAADFTVEDSGSAGGFGGFEAVGNGYEVTVITLAVSGQNAMTVAVTKAS
jgi:hypothetical protein